MNRLLITACLALVACASADAPAQSRNTATAPDVPTAPTFGGRLQAATDVQVTQFASVRNARAMVLGADGSVYVSQPSNGQITRLVDTNHDGVADVNTVVLRGLNQPHGMAFHGGWMYVANTNAVVRFRLGVDGLPGGQPQTIATYTWGQGHSTRSIVFGPDSMLYVSIGSSCNICVERTPDRASVMRFDPDGAGGRVFAAGLRNAVGMAVNPVTGKIWVSQNERDDVSPNHQDLPPEEINILDDGANYGWPYCYGNRVPNPEFNDAARCATTTPPALMMQAHSAPLGMSFLSKATLLPERYRGDLLLAFHGSWDRDVPTGDKVVRVVVKNGLPVSYEDFIVGWQLANDRWGRPVDVLVAADGSVLISDDANGAIYRVTRR